MILLPVLSLLLFQQEVGDTLLAARIQDLLQVVLTTDDEKQKEAAEAEAKDIFTKRGLPTIAAVGDEAAYEFVLLTCSPGPASFIRKCFERQRRKERDMKFPLTQRATARHICGRRR